LNKTGLGKSDPKLH